MIFAAPFFMLHAESFRLKFATVQIAVSVVPVYAKSSRSLAPLLSMQTSHAAQPHQQSERMPSAKISFDLMCECSDFPKP